MTETPKRQAIDETEYEKAMAVGEEWARKAMGSPDMLQAASGRIGLAATRALMTAIKNEIDAQTIKPSMLLAAMQPLFANAISTVLLNSSIPPPTYHRTLTGWWVGLETETLKRTIGALGGGVQKAKVGVNVPRVDAGQG